MKIGSVEIPELCRLAPMAAISNAPFRLIAKECGSGLTTTEEIDAFALLMETPRSHDMAAYFPQERPLAMQLLGKDPQALVRAALRCEELGADIVDLNMGCPAKEVTGGLSGSALMRDLDQAERLIAAAVGATSRPVTLKMRLGWDDASRNAPELAARAEAGGVRAITVHARTRQQFYKGPPDWRAVAEVKAATALPVIVNGDVRDAASAREALNQSGEIGRAHV